MVDTIEANDKLSLMYVENKSSSISINTPLGRTNKFEIEDIEMQGSVLAPIKTSVQIDSIGKECLEKGENLYLYKNTIPVPPLAFVDDIAAFSKCGQKYQVFCIY